MKGFSLIEVLVGIVLLVGLVSIVIQLAYGNTRRIKKSRQLEKVASLLEVKMRELEEEFVGDKIASLPSQNEGQFEGEENYFWKYETQPLSLPSPDLLLSLIQFPQSEVNSKMVQALTGVLSDTVVELKLTVQFKTKKGKELNHSLVSYFINYEGSSNFIFYHVGKMLPTGGSL